VRVIGRLILVSVLLGGSLGLGPQALASSGGHPAAPSTGARSDAANDTLQGRFEVLEGDDFTHGRTIDTYELVTDQGDYELLFGPEGPGVAASGSIVTVRGTLTARTITVATDGITVVSGGATPSVAPVATGAKRVAVILMNFSDNTSQPYTPAFAVGIAFTNADSVAAFYNGNSWGKLTISGDVFGWYTIPNTSTTCDYDAWGTAADAAATAAGVNLSSYDHLVYAFPHVLSCTWGGTGYMPGSKSWNNGAMNTYLVAHELGHNFGAAHANSYDCTNNGVRVALSANAANCTVGQYGDPFDVMGGNPHDFSNFERGYFGWLTASNTLDVTTTGTYTLAPDEPYSPTGVQALRIAHDASSYLMLEFRQPYGTFDNWATSDPVVNGVTVRLTPSYANNVLVSPWTGTLLMDTTPDTSSYSDAPLAVGSSFYDPVSGVLVTTQSVSGSGAVVQVVVTPPGKPTGVSATAGAGSASVSWAAPADNGGGIIGYTVTSSPDGKTCSTTIDLTCTVFGLTGGTAYTFTVTANGAAVGPASDPSNSVTVLFSGATYHAITPARILDSRDGTGGLSGPFSSHIARTFQVTGNGGVPSSATAVTGNLTVTQQSSLGFLFIGPAAQNNPTSSTLNFPVGDDRANAVTVALAITGTLSVTYAAPTLGPTAHVIFDVTGYFTPDATGATYHALTPKRLLDSRDGTGGLSIFNSHVAQSFQVSGGTSVVPANAIAVTGNLTVTQQTKNGFLYIGPDQANNPSSSTLNFPYADDRANAVTVALGTNGVLWVTYAAPTLGPTAHVIFDVTGYFTPDMTGATFVPLAPRRLLDSRDGTGGLSIFNSHVAQSFQVSGGTSVVPANAIAVTGNLTVTQQTKNGFLYIGPDSMNDPTSSTLNFPLGDDRANAVDVALSSAGKLSVTYAAPTPGPTAQVIFDVTGYFLPASS
jgi:hypothetical protein